MKHQHLNSEYSITFSISIEHMITIIISPLKIVINEYYKIKKKYGVEQ